MPRVLPLMRVLLPSLQKSSRFPVVRFPRTTVLVAELST
jgi:hypothetical protein